MAGAFGASLRTFFGSCQLRRLAWGTKYAEVVVDVPAALTTDAGSFIHVPQQVKK